MKKYDCIAIDNDAIAFDDDGHAKLNQVIDKTKSVIVTESNVNAIIVPAIVTVDICIAANNDLIAVNDYTILKPNDCIANDDGGIRISHGRIAMELFFMI